MRLHFAAAGLQRCSGVDRLRRNSRRRSSFAETHFASEDLHWCWLGQAALENFQEPPVLSLEPTGQAQAVQVAAVAFVVGLVAVALAVAATSAVQHRGASHRFVVLAPLARTLC